MSRVVDVLNASGYANIPGKDSKGPGPELIKTAPTVFNNSKSMKLFPDFKYRTLQESISDLGVEFEARGIWA